jgi:spermidine synthase
MMDRNAQPPSAIQRTPRRGRYLHLVAFTSGAAVMALELLGTRLLAPVCGMSIHVWAATITVTLASVAVGYAHGGKAADEAGDARPLGHLLLAAGISMGVLAACAQPALRLLAPLDLRLAALLGSLVLFGFPLACLGAAMPFCVKLATSDPERVGRTVGSLYLASTVGSCVGTLAAGFVLIPHVGVSASLVATAVGLTVLGAIGCLRGPWLKRLAVTAIVVAGTGLASSAALRGREEQRGASCMDQRKQLGLALPMYASDSDEPHPEPGSAGSTVAEASTIRRVFRRESLAGRVEVWTSGFQRLLLVDGMLQTAMPVRLASIGARPHLLPEKYWLELLPHFRPHARTALLIGLGGGLLPRVLDRYGIETRAVEIDPTIAQVAREHFGYFGRVTVADGRRFLRDTKEKYDFVILDAFTGDSPPSHLLTREALREAKRVLNPNGVLAINVIEVPANGQVLGALDAALRDVFVRRVTYGTDAPANAQMVTLFATDGELVPEPIPHGPTSQANARELTRAQSFVIGTTAGASGRVLLDDRNPFEVLHAPVAIEWRKRTGDLLAF